MDDIRGKVPGYGSKSTTRSSKPSSDRKEKKVPLQLTRAGLTDTKPFKDALEYMRKRYFSESGKPTCHLGYLDLGHMKSKVENGLLSKNPSSPEESAAAVLIVVNRYRNRLFHGEKWRYNELQNQRQNFTHANDVLKQAIKLAKKVKKQSNLY